jgi:hypothetical protein
VQILPRRPLAEACHGAERLQDQHLVAKVQVRGRFLEEQDAGLLRQRPGDERQLALASADLDVAPIPQVGNAQWQGKQKTKDRFQAFGQLFAQNLR